MDLVSINILKDPNMKATGRKTSNMDKEKKPGKMVQNMKVCIPKERNTVLVYTNGLMALLTRAVGLITKYKAKENISGLMEEFMKAPG